MFPSKKTKIIATIGPASNSREILEKIITKGVDCIRLNFSHGTHESHQQVINLTRSISKKLQKQVGIIADIQGPKMRVGKMPQEGLELKDGQIIKLDCDKKEYEGEAIPLPSDTFMEGVTPGATVFIDDGLLQITITKKIGHTFEAKVIKGGKLFSNKGTNVPSLYIKDSILNEKDTNDIKFAAKAGADYIALSFLRNGQDVKDAKKLFANTNIKVIAKIERPEALENLDSIIAEADVIMIARGDLGIETPMWELPLRQKEIISHMRAKMKPVIVATQMLDSMIRNPLPTRAEISDVANAVYDSTDVVMLSGETPSGKYPVETVAMMRKVLESSETIHHGKRHSGEHHSAKLSLAGSATDIAFEIGAKAILVKTFSGDSARIISHFRPNVPIIAITSDSTTACQLALVRGVTPFLIKKVSVKDINVFFDAAISALQKEKLLGKGDSVVCLHNERVQFSGKVSVSTISVKYV